MVLGWDISKLNVLFVIIGSATIRLKENTLLMDIKIPIVFLIFDVPSGFIISGASSKV